MVQKGRGNVIVLSRRYAKTHPIYTITIPRAIAEALGWNFGDFLKVGIINKHCIRVSKPQRQHKAKMYRQLEDVGKI